MTIRNVDFKQYISEMVSGHYDVAASGWIADFNDPINMLEIWTSNSGNNICFLGR